MERLLQSRPLLFHCICIVGLEHSLEGHASDISLVHLSRFFKKKIIKRQMAKFHSIFQVRAYILQILKQTSQASSFLKLKSLFTWVGLRIQSLNEYRWPRSVKLVTHIYKGPMLWTSFVQPPCMGCHREGQTVATPSPPSQQLCTSQVL